MAESSSGQDMDKCIEPIADQAEPAIRVMQGGVRAWDLISAVWVVNVISM